MKVRRRSRAQGFTLIELLLVVVIIGILAAIVVPKLAGKTEDARQGGTIGQMKIIQDALARFELDNGKYPSQDQGLLALIELPTAAPVPKKWTKYLEGREIPKDGWGNEFEYRNPGQVNTDGYDLVSAGPDGQSGNDDDIIKP